MKKIECEACGSNDLLKQGDFFVCQSCGCKYTVEDVRKMMIEGTVEVKGTVSIDTSKKEQGLLDLCEAAYKNNDKKELEKHATKLLEVNPNLWQGWFYRGFCAERYQANSYYDDLPVTNKEALTFYEKAYSVASNEEKEKARLAIGQRRLAIITDGAHRSFPGNWYNVDVETSVLNKEMDTVFSSIDNIVKEYDLGPIILHDAEDKLILLIYNTFLAINDDYLQKDFTDDKTRCCGDYKKWLNNSISLINVMIHFLNARVVSPVIVENCYSIFLKRSNHILKAHRYTNDCEYSRRTGQAEWVYHDRGSVADEKTKNGVRNTWERLKEAKPAYLKNAEKREEKYHQLKNEMYWSSHKEEKEKLESDLANADKQRQPYLSEINELDEDIANQKALLGTSLKEEETALALKQEADAAQAEFKKIGLFDKNRKAAKEAWQKKLDAYEIAQKKANDARTIFNTRINGNIKELEAEKAKILKALSSIEKDYASIKEELTKNR